MKSQMCANMNCIRITPMNISNWMEKDPQGLNPVQRTIGNKKLQAVEIAFPREKHIDMVSSVKMVSPKSIHTINTVWTEQLIFCNICIYIYS